jgi:hypothetical protein
VVESADLRHCQDIATLGCLDRAWLGRVFPESEMRAGGVIGAEVIAKATAEVSFVQHDHVVEEFAPDGSDHTLSERVLPRGVRRDEDLGKTDGLHPLSKLSAEDAVAIADEKPGRRVVGEGLDNLLRRPSRGRGVGHVEMYDSAAVINLATKRKALDTCAPGFSRQVRRPSWKRDENLLAWLEHM